MNNIDKMIESVQNGTDANEVVSTHTEAVLDKSQAIKDLTELQKLSNKMTNIVANDLIDNFSVVQIDKLSIILSKFDKELVNLRKSL